MSLAVSGLHRGWAFWLSAGLAGRFHGDRVAVRRPRSCGLADQGRWTAQQVGRGRGVPCWPSREEGRGRIHDIDPSGARQELGTLSEAPDPLDAPDTVPGGSAVFGETGVCVSLVRRSQALTRGIPAFVVPRSVQGGCVRLCAVQARQWRVPWGVGCSHRGYYVRRWPC